MEDFRILFEYSPWFILLCIVVASGYALLLYQPKKGPWTKGTNRFLFGLRFLLAFILCLLLLSPFIKQFRRSFEPPQYIVAIDNSLSIAEAMDSSSLNRIRSQVEDVYRLLEEKGNARLQTLTSENIEPAIDSLRFDAKSTDLSKLLNTIRDDYENRNLAGVVLISDGIFNLGVSPTYIPYNFPVYAVGVGDTIPKKDINLKNLYYNKLAYQGNQFKIIAEISQAGFQTNRNIAVSLSERGKTLQTKTINLPGENDLHEIEFIIDAKEEGLKHYVVSVSKEEGEFTYSNNIKHAYIDIIEGKEKILLVAPSPHPDIKALRNAIEKNQNYSFSLYIPDLTDYKQDTYDLIIWHQVPSRRNIPNFNQIYEGSKANWFILGSQSDLNAFNRLNSLVQVSSVNNQTDQVFPVFNSNFNLFNYSSEHVERLSDFPPVIVPFGNTQLSEGAEALLYQQVGNIQTERPLMVLNNKGAKKTGVLLGEGIWQWRLQEYASHKSFDAFDELVQKTVQLLSAKEDRRQFRVYPVSREVYDTEGVTFQTELYNQVFEKIYGQKINLTIKDEQGQTRQFSYVNSQGNSRYKISNLPQGIYSYTATTTVNGERLVSSGEFTVNELQLESLNLTANFNLLRDLADKTGGEFYLSTQMDKLKQDLAAKEAKSLVFTDEDFLPIISLEWLVFVLLLLVSLEWFVRKYSGSY